MLNSSLETPLGNNRIFCFINSNFHEPHREGECYKKEICKRFDPREYIRFSIKL